MDAEADIANFYRPGMNSTQGKEQELLTLLDNLEKSYNPQSPAYKFSCIFYNIVDRPFERPANFPAQLWEQALLPDRSLMPVILNKSQIDERKAMQNDLAQKINDSRAGIFKKIEALRLKRETLRGRLEAVVRKYRRAAGQYLLGEPNDDANKISADVFSREPYSIRSSHAELLECLAKMKARLMALEAGVGESLSMHEKRHIKEYQLDMQ